MPEQYAPRPWRFVATRDLPELGILKNDIVTAIAGGKTRISRSLPVNPGLLLNLACLGDLVEVESVIGPDAAIVSAMESADQPTPTSPPLRVVR